MSPGLTAMKTTRNRTIKYTADQVQFVATTQVAQAWGEGWGDSRHKEMYWNL